MKARIVDNTSTNVANNTSTNGIPIKLLKDKSYAKEFWEYLCKANPNENYGDSFEEWYDKLTTLNFVHKVQRLDSAYLKRNGNT